MHPGRSMAYLSLYLVTLNCGREPIDSPTFASQLFNGLHSQELPDVLVLSLQEVAPIAQSFLGGSLLDPYFHRLNHAVVSACEKLDSTELPLRHVISRNVGMTGIMVFARDPGAIQEIEAAGVGFGAWDTGSKGAVGIRFTYEDPQDHQKSTKLTFVAAHLAAMEGAVQRRNEDWKSTVERLVFSPADSTKPQTQVIEEASTSDTQPLLQPSSDTSIYSPTSHLFVFGDLNYRTSSKPPALLDHVDTFPQPDDDPTSNKHYSKYFSGDQLTQERKAGRTLHGFSEAKITFAPTYKFKMKASAAGADENSEHWEWAVHRWPSWCDRILYLDIPPWLRQQQSDAKIITHKYSALPLMATTDHRAVALSVSVPLIPIPSPNEDEESEDPRVKPPFDVDPTWKSKRFQARSMEKVVGVALYFTTTFDGITILVATLAGLIGGLYLMRSALDL